METTAQEKAANIKGGVLGLARHEMPKFFAMSFLMFCIIYVFTLTRDTKDTLIVTNCGAESIAFLKVYGVVPAAAAFMIGYNFLSNKVSHRALFHMTIIPFFAFYALFGFVLYPLRDKLHHPDGALTKDDTPLAYLLNLGRFWMFSLYYIVSELWGSAGIPLLFWTCANDVTPIHQAKRFYSLFGLIGNLAPVFSGQTAVYVRNRLRASNAGLSGEGAFSESIRILTAVMMGAGAIILTLYEYVQRLRDKELALEPVPTSAKGVHRKEKPKMGFIESFRFLAQSSYLRHISVLVLSYGLSMELTEIIWKAIVKLAFPDKTDYLAFMGQYSKIVGLSTFFMLLIGNKLIGIFGWIFGALTTPVCMLIFSIPFFAYITFGDIQSSKTSLMRALYIGMVQNVISKAAKYALFDPTKEMAYIPLDKESKVKGKAAIDVLGARLGKSGGALAQQGLVMMLGSILAGAPALAVMFILVNFAWISNACSLSKAFHEKTAHLNAKEG